MNEGARLDDIIHTVAAPPHLLEKPYLRPIYDDPEFIVRNLWRLYGGWYDGNPSHLKPARDAALASELAGLAGGADVLARRAVELAATGERRRPAPRRPPRRVRRRWPRRTRPPPTGPEPRCSPAVAKPSRR